MSAIGSAIIAACVGVAPSYLDACEKALDATVRQTGIRARAELVESQSLGYAEIKIKKNLSSNQLQIVYSSLLGYRILRDKKISFRLPDFGLCNSITNDISTDHYTLNFGWKF